ncbi:hypothetical protein LAV60_03900 [Clostridium sporogenes]|uniref:hypothetical protein n=1 Tax=Clostridium sporogenes TaxID=1509 RepID=UPI0005EE0A5B|nr:hypothetical protein [Clostridium sporogenes]MCW6092317.1 hypothetical protein [Clostridium sporogenes]NFG95663.1 hypothetical protein [Clostridium sporogenes]NFH34168.1 hypothetical protein [Clostridium sporogenes]NFL21414.1 hypothetical protein [Clostridium sporogenes]NFL76088.1 hypothetical protein [Clostridium sporogenes]
MIKIFKTLVLAGVVIGAIGITSYNIMASDRVENLALEDYKAGQKDCKAGQNQSAKYILPKKNQDGLQLSDFSLPIYSMAETKYILSSDGKNISKLLQSTDKKLWFMMNEDEPEGIVVANDVRPIKMGGKNRSKDLMKIYKDIKNNVKSKENIKYFEFEGQGIFVISHNNIDEIYLSIGASKVLDMEAGKKISSKEFMSQMKKYISNLQ